MTDGLYKNIEQWHGMENYECKICGFSTVRGEDSIQDHVTHAHPTSASPDDTAKAHADSLKTQLARTTEEM